MSNWPNLFLGVIAAATILMAAIQVGAAVFAIGLARRVNRVAEQIEQDVKPLLASLNAISCDAARVASLAAVQVERADRLFADLSQRVEQTLAIVQNSIVAPAREGMAVVSGLRAAMAAFRELRDSARSRSRRAEDEDALFIG